VAFDYRRPAVTIARLLCCAAVASLGALASAGTAAAQDCPGDGLLLFGGAVYSEEPVPAEVSAERGAALGAGRLAFLTEEAGCGPQDVEVLELAGVTQDLAVAVADRPGFVFVLGARCAGFEGEERASCILDPLVYDGREYTAARYPGGASPGRLVPGAALESAELGGESLAAVELEGVDPAVAVGVEGRPDEAFVAVGACPYERFDEAEANDDLLRCLQGPLWLVFELERPPAAQAGEAISARADRAVSEVVDGADLSFVLIEGGADVVPRSLEGATAIGTLDVQPDGSVTVPITVPDVDTGIYEAIVTCEACADAFGGTTVFPAGSLAIVGGTGGGGGPRTLGIVLGALFVIAIVGSVIAWRRGWLRYGTRRRGPQGPA
jgi:hypothetical protein